MVDDTAAACRVRGCAKPLIDRFLCDAHRGTLKRHWRWYMHHMDRRDYDRALEMASRVHDICPTGEDIAPGPPEATPEWLAVVQESAATQARVSTPPKLLSLIEPSLSICPHEPHPRQQEFLDLTCEEAFFGGAAGGGKSDALLMAALQYAHVDGYRALIVRRSYQDLAKPGAIMDRSKEWLMNREGCKWSEVNKCWTITIDGATSKLQFGFLESEDDKLKYQSTEYQFVGFDELTHFDATQYLYLFSRLRRLVSCDIPLRMRSASNPGGRGHRWVMRRFVKKKAFPPFWTDIPETAFIPSKLHDNPSLDAESYKRSLSRLDEETRAQLLDGIWGDGTPKYGPISIVEELDVSVRTYPVLRVTEDMAVRLVFCLIGDRVRLVSIDASALPDGSDRLVVCTPSIGKEIKRVKQVEPRKLRGIFLRNVCSRVDISKELDLVLGALGADPAELNDTEAAILDALVHAPEPKAFSIRVDRMDLSEEALLEEENAGTDTREWWRPQNIGSRAMPLTGQGAYPRR